MSPSARAVSGLEPHLRTSGHQENLDGISDTMYSSGELGEERIQTNSLFEGYSESHGMVRGMNSCHTRLGPILEADQR